MRVTRAIGALLTCGTALSLACTPQHQEGMKAEFVREVYKSPIGAAYVVGVLGSGVPSGGPSSLHAVGMDLAWRSFVGRHFEMSGPAPSPFDPLDPNRLVEIRKVNETTTEYIFRDPDRPGAHSTVTVTETKIGSP